MNLEKGSRFYGPAYPYRNFTQDILTQTYENPILVLKRHANPLCPFSCIIIGDR